MCIYAHICAYLSIYIYIYIYVCVYQVYIDMLGKTYLDLLLPRRFTIMAPNHPLCGTSIPHCVAPATATSGVHAPQTLTQWRIDFEMAQ